MGLLVKNDLHAKSFIVRKLTICEQFQKRNSRRQFR